MRRWVLRLVSILLPVAAGAALLIFLVTSREPPERHPPEETVRAVRVIAVPEIAVVPRAVGHGVVQPARVWEGVAEVGARVIEEDPDLNRGAVVAAGTVLLRLDPTEVELRVAQADAAIEGIEARLNELAQREANTRASLAIERRTLALGAAELDRRRELFERGATPRSALEQEERRFLAVQQSVQTLENVLALLPAERRVLAAERRQREAEFETARLDLARTDLTLPFDARLAQVNVRRDQFAQRGQVLVVADAIDLAEVDAQVPLDRMRHFLADDPTPMAFTPETVRERVARLGLRAAVRLHVGEVTIAWPGRVARISDSVDPQTRTLGVIVEVDEPYGKVVPGMRPPLVKNMFVEIELYGRPLAPRAVIPRTALHAGQIYVVNESERLEVRRVTVAHIQGEIAVIADGLDAGERVVVSDLVPAIAGMRLAPSHDDELLKVLYREAAAMGDGS